MRLLAQIGRHHLHLYHLLILRLQPHSTFRLRNTELNKAHIQVTIISLHHGRQDGDYGQSQIYAVSDLVLSIS